jgi:site-specific recombinase XerD
MIIDEGLQKFLVQLEADGRSPHTQNQYKRHVRLFASWARDVGLSGDISEISHEDVARFLASPTAKTRPDGGLKKATSANALRTSLKCFFRYLHEGAFVSQNPARLVRRAICGTPPPKVLSEADAAKLLDTLAAATSPAGRRDHALFHLMLATGIRIGSAVALDVEDVDLERGELWLRSTKNNRPDRVFLGKVVVQHLRDFIGSRTSGPLFQARDGRRLSLRHAQRRFEEWMDKAAISAKVSVHGLRHSFAMRIYQRTGDLLLTQAALKHRSICSTMVYTRVGDDQLRKALQD